MPDKILDNTDDQKAKDCEKYLDILKQIRQPYEAMIDNILTYVHHGRRKITDKGAQKGQKTGIDIYDGTALGALNLMADGLSGYTMSKSYRWFEYTLPGKLNFPRWSGMRAWSGKRMDEYPDVKEWLEACEEVLYAAFLRSNFYDVSPEIVKDAGSVGTVNIILEEDIDAGRTIFTIPHFRECYIAENIFGQVDTNYRVYKLSLRSLVKKFTLEKMMEVKRGFKKDYENNPYDELEVIHATYPRNDYDPEKVNGKNKPVASLWVLREPRAVLLESGYDESPKITWRWMKNNDEWYGRSPCWNAYIDVMTANQQGKTNLEAGHKMVHPPMVAPETLRGLVRSGPGGWTFVPEGFGKENMPLPLNEKLQLPFAVEMQDRYDAKIKEHLHVDFFLMLSQAAMENRNLTATQVIEMTGEKAAVLGPRIGRMESEALNPVHDRMFAIEKRAGRIPEPPEILMEYGGEDIEIDYMGPLSQAQKKLFKSQGIRGGLEALAPLATIHPETVHVVDPYETAKDLLESSGFPSKDLRDKEAFDEIVQGIRQQQEVAETIASGSEIAKALPSAGKAPEEGSPLAEMMTEGTA